MGKASWITLDLGFREQCMHWHPQHACDSHQIYDSEIVFTALYTTNVGTVHFRGQRQLFLGKPPRLPYCTHSLTYRGERGVACVLGRGACHAPIFGV